MLWITCDLSQPFAAVSADRVTVALQLRLMLPDGRETLLAAKYGQTVQYTKAVLCERFDLPIDQQVGVDSRL